MMTEHDTDVRGWLESVEAPPPRLDLADIVQIGRAQVRRRRQLAAGGSAAVALAVGATLPVAVQSWPALIDGSFDAADFPVLDCTVTQLPVPAGESQGIRVIAMDSTGRYLVGEGVQIITEAASGVTSWEPAAMTLWTDGEPIEIPTLRGTASVAGVNSSGVVVGTGFEYDERGGSSEDEVARVEALTDLYGWVYHDGAVTELPAPPGYRVSAVAGIGDAGDIAATVTDDEGASRPVVWRSLTPGETPREPQFLAVPGDLQAEVTGIADDGTVVGAVGTVSQPDPLSDATGGYAWDRTGAGRELPLPEGVLGAYPEMVRGDWAVGYARVPVPIESIRQSPSFGPSDMGTPQEPSGSPVEPTVTPVEPSGMPSPTVSPPPGDSVTPAVAVPVRWNLRNGAVELLDPEVEARYRSDVFPTDVSANGDVVVDTLDAVLLYRDQRWFSLPFGGESADAHAISADGTLIGGQVYTLPQGSSEQGSGTPVVWHC